MGEFCKGLKGLFADVEWTQPPSGGCVLKLRRARLAECDVDQPPSGGCVLKLPIVLEEHDLAASRLRAAVC